MSDYYESHQHTVHQTLVSFTTVQLLEDWFKADSGYRKGRRSMTSSRNHFAGEGNAARNISEAEQLCDSFYYNN